MTDTTFHRKRISNYDENWSKLLLLAQERISAGESVLSRALRQVEATWRNTDELGPSGGTAFGREVQLPKAALIGGRQALWRQVLLNECRANTDLVLEIGSGWGNNLLDLYTGGGPKRAMYFGLRTDLLWPRDPRVVGEP